LAFKPDVDDLRESPAAEVVRLLQEHGAQVTTYEPYRPEGLPGIPAVPDLPSAVAGADAIRLLVAHRAFAGIDPASLLSLTPARVAIDTVGVWDAVTWESAGFRLVRLGSNKPSRIAAPGQ
jgi:UDP-N-acetyl-D-mannosaminuronate dehydrogenase